MKIKHLLWICLLLLTFGCSRKNQPEETLVARVGSEKITFDELEKSLMLNPQYATRMSLRQARESQLKYLIEQRLYFLAAEKVDFEDIPEIAPKLKYIREQETLKAFIEKKFLDRLPVDETEIIRAIAKLNKKVRVQHLFVPTEQEARQLEQRLQNGETFSDLAKEVFRDERLRNNGGEIGWITYGQIDPVLEGSVYRLKSGEISPPVKSRYGYHILRVLEVKENDQVRNISSFNKTQMVAKIIKQRKADRQIRDFLKELSGGEKIRVNNRVLELLAKETGKLNKEKYTEPGLFVVPVSRRELDNIQISVSDVLDEPLARFGDREMRVRDFLQRLKEMPPYHRPYLRGKTRLAQAIIDLIRNNLLLKEAQKEGVQNEETVKNNYRREMKELLANEFSGRVNSAQFRKNYPGEWQKYSEALQNVRQKYPARISEEQLFHDVPNPDSVFVDQPIHLFLKNRYVW